MLPVLPVREPIGPCTTPADAVVGVVSWRGLCAACIQWQLATSCGEAENLAKEATGILILLPGQ